METVGQRLVAVGLRADEQHALVVRLAAEFADGHEWVAAGYSTPGRWIADMLDIARRTANEWIRVGRALRGLPGVRAAFEAKAISFAKVKELTRTATSENEAELVALSQRVSAAELSKAIAAWSMRHEPDEVIDERQRGRRSYRSQVEPDGSVVLTIRLPPADGGQVNAAVDARVIARSRKLRPMASCWPSLAQQRLDAFVDLPCGGGASVATEVVVHVRGDGCSLDDGTPLTSAAVARLLPDGFVRALVHDAEGRPINASGRRRFPTARQRRVVKERDRVCVDCGSTELLEYDHVPAYEETGRTVVEELRLRCGPCHRARHAA